MLITKQKGYVYIVTTENKWPCKIGYTSVDVHGRLRNLQIGYWERLYLHKSIHHRYARYIEDYIKQELDNWKLIGEWYATSAQDMSEVLARATNHFSGLDAFLNVIKHTETHPYRAMRTPIQHRPTPQQQALNLKSLLE